MKTLTHIGTSELVSLPELGVLDVPAKVDTGADSSAIWASNIVEQDGELFFTLFGPTSPRYTGETIRTHKYTLVTVKNSFGQRERRYKVDFALRIGGRKIRARITLANRSNNRYPILIGRRTLKGKFLVDVSKNNANNNKVLLIHATRGVGIGELAEAVSAEGLEVNTVNYRQLVFKTGDGVNRIEIAESGEDLADYSLVYFSTSTVFGHSYVTSAIAEYLALRNVDFVDRAVIQSQDPPKLLQYIKMTDNNLPVPKTLFMLPKKMKDEYELLVSELGLPFVLKDNEGSQGRHNYLIKEKNEFDRIMRQTIDLGVWMLAQQFIPNDYDYRLLVIGGRVQLVMKRTRTGVNSHLNNTSVGSSASLSEVEDIPPRIINAAVASAKLLQLQIAGVDIVRDKQTDLWYCLEVNKSPQIYSGSYRAEKELALAKYFSQRIRN